MKTRKVSFHGHSIYSDGQNTVDELVHAAAIVGIDYFGITDHGTTRGVPLLYDAIAKMNEEKDLQIVPVAGCEIHPKEGEVLIAKPGEYDSSLMKWCESLGKKKVSVIETIKYAINEFNALVVIPHGGDRKAKGISFDTIERIVDSLNEQEQMNLGLEVRNWSMRLFRDHSSIREKQLDTICKKHSLATLGFSDFHEPWVIAEQYSVFDSEEKDTSAKELYQAFQNRKIKPAFSTIDTLRYIKLVKSIGLAFLRTHTPTSFKKNL